MATTFRIFAVLLVSIFLLNCASFSNKTFKNDYNKMNPETILSLNGKYSFFPIKKFDKKKEHSNLESLKKYINSYNYMTNEIVKFTDLDSTLNGLHFYHLELILTDNTTLNLELFKNNQSVKKQQIKGELKKDGMFYLDNKFLECNGIPYLFGGCQNNKRRIAVSKQNNLIINEAVCNEGAVLFMGAGVSYNTAYEFKRLE